MVAWWQGDMVGIVDGLVRRVAVRHEVQRLRPSLYRVAYGWCRDAQLADDLAQQAVEKALRNAAQARDPASLKGWLYRILANCLRDHFRALRPHEDLDALAETIADAGTGPEDACARNQLGRRVRVAVGRLPLAQRQVVILVDLEECSYAEVAQALGIPVGTVMSRLCRARRALRDTLIDTREDGQTTRLRSVK